MTDPKAQKEIGTFYGKPINANMTKNELLDVIRYLGEEFKIAEERGRQEVIAELERQVEDGGSAEVILAAVKRNFTP